MSEAIFSAVAQGSAPSFGGSAKRSSTDGGLLLPGKLKPSDIVNTRVKPPGFDVFRYLGMEATAYHELSPYPYFAFREWRTEERGPYPKCLPLARAIVRKGALWLFGKPVQLNCTNDEVEESLKKAWMENAMDSRLVQAAVKGGCEGGIALKFSVTEDGKPRIQILSVNRDVRFFYNPHDRFDLWMARIQYPFQSPIDGEWFWYREEWTKDRLYVYRPTHIRGFAVSQQNPYTYVGEPGDPDVYDRWEIEREEPNRFGVIPVTHIKNYETETQYGIGDMWSLYRVLDRLNLVYHLMDRSNQLDSDPVKVFIDLQMEQDELDRALAPGQAISMKSDETDDGVPKEGRVQLLETAGKMRSPMETYAKDLRQMIYEATGAVFTRPEEITNKGNLTMSVLVQLYAPIIEVAYEKRKTYGDNGLVPFLRNMCVAFKNIGLEGFRSFSEDTDEVGLSWFNFFRMTEDEKFAFYNRISRELMDTLITKEIALAKIASLEEIPNAEQMIAELKDVPVPIVQGNVPSGSEIVGGTPSDESNSEASDEAQVAKSKKTTSKYGRGRNHPQDASPKPKSGSAQGAGSREPRTQIAGRRVRDAT